jgi:hypothetical protein
MQRRTLTLTVCPVTRLLEAGISVPSSSEHDGMVCRDRNPYGEALRTHRKQYAP